MNQNLTLYTIKQFAQTQPALKEAALRWQIFMAASNGLDRAGAIRRIGRRVYIIAERYFDWLDRQSADNAQQSSGVVTGQILRNDSR